MKELFKFFKDSFKCLKFTILGCFCCCIKVKDFSKKVQRM